MLKQLESLGLYTSGTKTAQFPLSIDPRLERPVFLLDSLLNCAPSDYNLMDLEQNTSKIFEFYDANDHRVTLQKDENYSFIHGWFAIADNTPGSYRFVARLVEMTFLRDLGLRNRVNSQFFDLHPTDLVISSCDDLASIIAHYTIAEQDPKSPFLSPCLTLLVQDRQTDGIYVLIVVAIDSETKIKNLKKMSYDVGKRIVVQIDKKCHVLFDA
ncbi:MAG TPA: hypothetical protein VJL60_02170, partial [Gammaproteobacteria bacterium]|nr:hypothetical protein [Gammaproteobacteria bacterium]